MRTPFLSGVEQAIGEVGPEHQQHVADAHSIVTRRETDQPGHTDVIRIVPFDVLLAAERVYCRCFETLA
jgi:hypothetical protein